MFTNSLNGQGLRFPTLSPITEIEQEIGLTKIGLSYSRPSKKGRAIFGDLVPYDQIWRTGANASTKLSFEEAIEIGGNPIEPGTYALYTIPNEDEWTIIIHKNTRLRSLAGDAYKQEDDVFRFQLRPERSSEIVETFTIQFADLTTNSCHLRLSWDDTFVIIPIKVDVGSKIDKQMADLLKNADQIGHRQYFRAAEFYLHNGRNLSKAGEWIDEALILSPENYRYGLLKSKILAADNQQDKAMDMIKKANSWAVKAGNANYIEQTQLFMDSLKNNK